MSSSKISLEPRNAPGSSAPRFAWLIMAMALGGHGAALPQVGTQPEPNMPPVSAPEGAEETSAPEGPPNLRILVEGNRRWCARKTEQVWPVEPKIAPVRRGTRPRAPRINTLAYAHYALAHPQSGPASPSGTPPPDEETPAAQTQAAQAENTPAEEVQQTPPAPEAAPAEAAPAEAAPAEAAPAEAAPAEAAPAEADGSSSLPGGGSPPPPTEDAGQTNEPSAEETEAAEMAEPPADPNLALSQGSKLISQSIVYRPLGRRRYQVRGKPPTVQTYWEGSRSCCNFPNEISATLSPGLYTIQVYFDVLMPRRGWQHVQMARIVDVEIKEGATNDIILRVETDGYVEVKPKGRVVRFEGPGAQTDPPAGAGQAQQSAPAEPATPDGPATPPPSVTPPAPAPDPPPDAPGRR